MRPAQGDRANRLAEVQRLAFEIIKLAELERAGIRDGAGWWYGCNPLDHTISDLCALWRDGLADNLAKERN